MVHDVQHFQLTQRYWKYEKVLTMKTDAYTKHT